MELYSETNGKGPCIRNETYLRKPRNSTNFLYEKKSYGQIFKALLDALEDSIEFPRRLRLLILSGNQHDGADSIISLVTSPHRQI